MKFLSKIAIVSPSCPPSGGGGIDAAHYNLALLLQNAGYSVEIFTVNDNTQVLNPALVVHRFGTPPFISKLICRFCGRYFHLKDKGKMAYQVQDIYLSQMGAWRARTALKKFSPDMLILPDHGCPGLTVKKIGQEKTLVIYHHNPARFTSPLLFNRAMSIKDIQLAVKLENKALRHVDAVVCPTRYMKDFFLQSHSFSGPVEIIPNIVDCKLLASILPKSVALCLGRPASSPVLYIPSGGSGSGVKGARYLFELIRRISRDCAEALFFVSGGISEPLAYELQASGLMERVFAPDPLAYEENLAYASSCSLCLSPTLAETFGMALLEAGYYGLPAVTFDVGGNAEVVREGKTGFLLPLLDVDGLVEKTLYLLKTDNGDVLHAMRAATARHVRQRLSQAGVAAAYAALFAKLSGERPCPRP